MEDKTIHIDQLLGQTGFPSVGHYLVVTQGQDVGRRIELSSEPALIGRMASAMVNLNDPGVSSRHCQIWMYGDTAVVEDLNSTNGTLIDKARIDGKGRLPVGSMLQIGATLFKHESRNREEVRREEKLKEELSKATAYVESLLPRPMTEGPVRAAWHFIPSVHLGGDSFGYHWIDEDRLAIYLLDVAGHGPRASLHSISVLNTLRRQTLGGVDFAQPDQVLGRLNDAFQMDEHGGLHFSAWYGVYQCSPRILTFASAGHPPALIVPRGHAGTPLQTRGVKLGLAPGAHYSAQSLNVAPGSRLYIYSDGVIEIVTKDGGEWNLSEFAAVAALPGSWDIAREPERIETAIRKMKSGELFDDDFSLVVLEFE